MKYRAANEICKTIEGYLRTVAIHLALASISTQENSYWITLCFPLTGTPVTTVMKIKLMYKY